jgi:hypothetical protein
VSGRSGMFVASFKPRLQPSLGRSPRRTSARDVPFGAANGRRSGEHSVSAFCARRCPCLRCRAPWRSPLILINARSRACRPRRRAWRQTRHLRKGGLTSGSVERTTGRQLRTRHHHRAAVAVIERGRAYDRSSRSRVPLM